VPQVVSDAQLDLEIDITLVHFNRLSESLTLSLLRQQAENVHD